MRTDLLLRGAELLEADAANQDGLMFNLIIWAEPGHGVSASEWKPGINCGTMGCAAGLFALSGAFKEEGLGFSSYNGEPFVEFKDGLGATQMRHGIQAMAYLFEIGNSTARRLFLPDYYQKTNGAEAELEVARRMRAVIAGDDLSSVGYVTR